VTASAEAVKCNDSDSYQLKIASLFRGYLNFDLVNTRLARRRVPAYVSFLTPYLSLDAKHCGVIREYSGGAWVNV
jgi:hypothetical protein